jgi:signal transduction histidine kinase
MTPTRILLVDDRPENLIALDASLRGDSLILLHARSGEEALEKLLVNDVALAILDVQMPGMDGFELAELMRGSERTRHIPIIFLTADSPEQERVFGGYERGAVDFLFKPYDTRVLVSKVNVFVELYRQRQELNDALRFSDLFVGILGHDLRSPLSAISYGAHALQMNAGDPKKAEIAGRILNSAKRMGRMIEEILDFTRFRIGGGIPLNLAERDLSELTATIVEELRLANPANAIRIDSRGDARVLCDSERIMQVLSNLIGNGLQYGTQGEPVSVVVDGSEANQVHIGIANQGTISGELLPQIFDPFKRASGTEQNRSGLGLGLYIAQQIVNSHRGNISVTSNGETVFRVLLPRK